VWLVSEPSSEMVGVSLFRCITDAVAVTTMHIQQFYWGMILVHVLPMFTEREQQDLVNVLPSKCLHHAQQKPHLHFPSNKCNVTTRENLFTKF
jgi:hypothetical protein